MNILFIGDIFGTVGRHAVLKRLDSLIEQYKVDFSICNGENAAGGIGITGNIFRKLRKYGINAVTGGNHSFAYAETEGRELEAPELLRPLNYPPGNPGNGTALIDMGDGRKVGIVNLQGRTFFHESLDCPFRTGLAAVETLRKSTPIIIVDFHAEATSEKMSMGWHLDGKVSAVLGTHTHVQTADERVLPGGTAFITDVGMTGPEDSVIGMKKGPAVRKFLLQTRVRFEPADGSPMLNAVVVSVDDHSGKAHSIIRLFERISLE